MNIDEIHNLCKTVHKTTFNDVRLLDNHGQPIYELLKHHVPTVIKHTPSDYRHLRHEITSHSPSHYYHYIDSFNLEYVVTGIWRDESLHYLLVVGPFLSTSVNNTMAQDILSRNKISISERKHLFPFYQGLAVIDSRYSHYLGSLVVNLCRHPFSAPKLIVTDHQPSLEDEPTGAPDKTERDNQLIEQRYAFEKKIMYAVSKGDFDTANQILEEKNGLLDIDDRFPASPLRSLKNYSIVFGTLLRIAAERGGLHPVYIHNLSEKHALLIEKIRTVPELKTHNLIMLTDYCLAVKNNTTNQYSDLIKKSLDYIHLNLSKQLSLRSISQAINVSDSHLSRQFKKELHMTLTDYINRERVKEAQSLLKGGNISITDAAILTGFSNLNYFSKVFKKVTNQSPSEFMHTSS